MYSLPNHLILGIQLAASIFEGVKFFPFKICVTRSYAQSHPGNQLSTIAGNEVQICKKIGQNLNWLFQPNCKALLHTLNLRSIPCLAGIVVFIYNAEIKSVNLTRPAVLHCLLKFDIHLRTIRAFEGSTLRERQGFFASACVRYSRALKTTSVLTFQAINLNSNLNPKLL